MSKHLRSSIKPKEEKRSSGRRLFMGVIYFLFLAALAFGVSYFVMNQIEVPEKVKVTWPDQVPDAVPNEFPNAVVQCAIGVGAFFVLYLFIALVMGFLGVGKEDNIDERGWWKVE